MTEKTETVEQQIMALGLIAGHHKHKSRKLYEQVSFHKKAEETIRGYIKAVQESACLACRGQGGRMVHYAQDDCSFEKCAACKGTGGRDHDTGGLGEGKQ